MIQASQQNQSITYLDAHDLYTWAMSKPPPVGGFEWITDFDNWRSTPPSSRWILNIEKSFMMIIITIHLPLRGC